MSLVPSPEITQKYKLEGRYRYGVYISTFDGEDYKFPIVDPVRRGRLVEIADSLSIPKATKGLWLDVIISPKQGGGYYGWIPTDDFILHMIPTHSFHDDKYAYVGRFSYNPESKEFLMGMLDQKHAGTIRMFGSFGIQQFNKYVRGIYLREQRLLLIRAYFDPLDEKGVYHDEYEFDPELDAEKADKTLEMLIKNNLPPDITVITRVDNEVVRMFESIQI